MGPSLQELISAWLRVPRAVLALRREKPGGERGMPRMLRLILSRVSSDLSGIPVTCYGRKTGSVDLRRAVADGLQEYRFWR